MKRERTKGGQGTRFEALEGRQMMAAAGALDTSFSLDGKATLEFGFSRFFAADVAVQRDGKTIVVGNTLRGPHAISDFVVARFNFDGSLDQTFGPRIHPGFVATTFDDKNASPTSVAIQPDGKILVAGHQNHDKWAVARYLPNGTLDTSFDGDGRQTIGFDGDANDILVQSDGKIVVVGGHLNTGPVGLGFDWNFAMARLNPNGRLDTTFNGGGKKEVGFGGEFEFAEAAAIDSQGRIIVVGDSSQPNGYRFAVTRLTRDGTKDTTFGDGGTVLTALPSYRDSKATGVTIQPDGKIVVVGSTGDHTISQKNFDFAVARYLPSGRLDPTFGAARTGMVEIGFGGGDHAHDVIRSNDGNLIVAGTSDGKFALAALTDKGALDRSFGTRGQKVTPAEASRVGLAQGAEMSRFVVAGGKGMQTARYLDRGANLLDLALEDREAAEQGRDKASLLVSRSERLPIPTRVTLNIGGTALGPTSGLGSQLDYDLSGVISPSSGSRNAPGTASAGSIIVTIPANQTSARITLTPRDDLRAEPRETATFALVPPAGFGVGGNASGTVTISDNDQAIFSATSTGRTASAPKLKLTGLFSDREIDRLV
jgi:uncharacterized delta-60 repeat protein